LIPTFYIAKATNNASTNQATDNNNSKKFERDGRVIFFPKCDLMYLCEISEKEIRKTTMFDSLPDMLVPSLVLV